MQLPDGHTTMGTVDEIEEPAHEGPETATQPIGQQTNG